ncbi:MAG TPA: type II toxin-antitoxin system PrlF family antitoxin [Gammaproteobacteria bacterium]|nr:type II toxin-antitoxin system PrlF family antitoxin [Gammaproteobacteria bacterium]
MRETVAISKLTSKYQATIPAPVREALDLHAGDEVAFDIQPGDGVKVRKATSFDVGFAKALEPTLASEWLSAADEEAWRDL